MAYHRIALAYQSQTGRRTCHASSPLQCHTLSLAALSRRARMFGLPRPAYHRPAHNELAVLMSIVQRVGRIFERAYKTDRPTRAYLAVPPRLFRLPLFFAH